MAVEVLLTTRKVKFIDKREFAAAALNVDNEIFMMHIAALAEPTIMPIYPSYQAQVATLTSKKIRIPTEYSDFSNVFSSDSAAELPELT